MQQGRVKFIGTHSNVKKDMTIINFSIVSQVVSTSYFNKLPGLGGIITFGPKNKERPILIALESAFWS